MLCPSSWISTKTFLSCYPRYLWAKAQPWQPIMSGIHSCGAEADESLGWYVQFSLSFAFRCAERPCQCEKKCREAADTVLIWCVTHFTHSVSVADVCSSVCPSTLSQLCLSWMQGPLDNLTCTEKWFEISPTLARGSMSGLYEDHRAWGVTRLRCITGPLSFTQYWVMSKWNSLQLPRRRSWIILGVSYIPNEGKNHTYVRVFPRRFPFIVCVATFRVPKGNSGFHD